MRRKIQAFTSESVTEGHPDKICDQISDAILDAIYLKDTMGRVACEVMVTGNKVIICGEITSKANIDIDKITRKTIRDIGYTKAMWGFNAKTCKIMNYIQEQSEDIAQGVDTGGAGDQGIMFGYACNETPELMPLPIMIAHKLAMKLADARKKKLLPYLGPDGKTEVTLKYDRNNKVWLETVVISTMHTSKVSYSKLRTDIINKIVKPTCKKYLTNNTRYYINPTGIFIRGGPIADSGLTGRKIVVDTYGGMARNGGGCLSGKDPTKVDRSAAYAARYIAKNIVAAGLADECEIQLSYVIGVKEPLNVTVNTFGSGKLTEPKLKQIIFDVFDLTPRGIIDMLNLRRPIYLKTSCYGHYGRNDKDFSWEKTDKVKLLKAVVLEMYGKKI